MQIPALAGAIDQIAGTVANIPIKLYRKKNNKVEEILNDERVFLLNKETGDTLDANQMKQAVVRDYFLGRGGFIYVDWDGLNVRSLRYVFSEYVSIAPNADVIFKDYAILVQGHSFFPSQFITILRNTIDGMYGNSIVEENKELISVCYNSLLYEKGLVKTGGNKRGFIKAPRKLDCNAINALKTAWNKLYSNSTENVMVLNDGIDFQEASNTSVEMQLNENKLSNANQLKMLLGVPEDISTENGDKAYIKYCINNFMGEFITALNRSLLLESEKEDYFFAADMNELTKGDIDKRYSAYQTAANTGWLQIDEIREKENMEPLGIDMVKLGLQDVLYNPKTKDVYIPNMDKNTNLENISMEEENIERAEAPKNLIITGAPGSGKSTYAQKIKKPNDMILDFDNLRIAMSGKSHSQVDDYEVLNRMRKTVFKYLNNKENKNRFLILVTEPNEQKLKYMSDYLNADIFKMPTSREQTIRQINKDKSRKNKQLFIDLANDYFDKVEGGENKGQE